MHSITSSKYAILLLIIFLTIVNTKDDSSITDYGHVDKDIKNISGINWAFFSRKTCGFIDRNLYLPNGTFESVLFFSNQPFSIIVEEDSSISLISGLTMSKQVNILEETQIKNNYQFYEINSYNQNNPIKQKNPTTSITVDEQRKRYFGNLSIYGACKTFAFSTDTKQINLQITFYPNREHQKAKETQHKYTNTINDRKQEEQQQVNQGYQANENRIQIKIGVTIYCIDGRAIKQANFVLSKLYQLLVMCVIGLTFSFSPFRNIPWWVSCLSLLGYLIWVYRIDSWYLALLTSYTMTFFIAICYRLSSPRLYPPLALTLTRTFIILSLASVFPLGIKSHLDNDSIQHKRILIHLVNFVILCNVLLFTQSLIHVQRFRHAFYYFVVFVVMEGLFREKVQHMVVFNLLEVQAFSEPVQCRSLFFTIMLIPLCDFFFKSYSSDIIFKFLILTAPLVLYPFHISSSTSFIMGFTLWIVKQLIRGKDISNVVRHKS